LRRVYKRRRAKEKKLIMIKTIAGITIGTLICSLVVTSSSTRSYFRSTASAEANVNAAQFSDLINYSFECVDLKNVNQGACGFIGGADLFNKWLIGHVGFDYEIDKGCYLDYEKHDTAIYPNNNGAIPEQGIIINPDSIKIYAGSSLKSPSPIIYFSVDGDIKEYIEHIGPVYCTNNGSKDPIGKTDVKINFNLAKFISDVSKNRGKDNGDIDGTMTIGYLNSYKYEKIPVKFTKEYLLYQFGRELFEELGIINSKNGLCAQSNSKSFAKAESDSDSSKDSAESIIGSYYQLNDSQKQMLDMISPELTGEIEKLINSYNELLKKYNDLLSEKEQLEKQLDEMKDKNSKLNDSNNEMSKKIDELNIQIETLKNEIDKFNSAASPSAQNPSGEKDNKETPKDSGSDGNNTGKDETGSASNNGQ
jgi:chaperonin cofactor prefoldin